MGSHSFLQEIFPTQGSNLGLLHCRQIVYHLSHQGRPSASEGSQCMPSPNMPLWHKNYFELKAFEKTPGSISSSWSQWNSIPYALWGFPGDAIGKESACQCRRHKRRRFVAWIGKIPWRSKWQSTPAFLPGGVHGQRSLAGYNPWGLKDSDMTEPLITAQHALLMMSDQHSSTQKKGLSPQPRGKRRLCSQKELFKPGILNLQGGRTVERHCCLS